MKLNKIETIIKKTELECKVDTITLLSIEEYERYRSLIPYINKYWWLRSPGSTSYSAAYVDDMGGINRDGYNVACENIGVRPALRLNISDSSNFQPGDKVQLLNLDWTVLDVSEDQIYVLADDIIGKHIFDIEHNDWGTSGLKVWLKNWLAWQILDYKKSENQKCEEYQTPKIYAYENSNGDKGIIIADNLSEAEKLFSAQYPERKICKSREDYWDNGAYLFAVGDVENNKLYCTFPW